MSAMHEHVGQILYVSQHCKKEKGKKKRVSSAEQLSVSEREKRGLENEEERIE